MARKSKKERVPMTKEQAAALRRAAMIGSTLLVMIVLSWALVGELRGYVEKKITANPDPPIVVLKNRPVWMSDFLADTIATSVRPDVNHSPLDHQLLVDAVTELNANAWIRHVNQVRRIYGRAP